MENQIRHIHPTKDIIGIKSENLQGKTICMCLTGSVAILNAPSIARELMRHGAEVITVMSEEAIKLIQPTLIEWATGNPVITEITGKIEHIATAGERENTKGIADMILICPATGNSIGKISHGISDNPVTAISMVALGSKTPMAIVPAMHDSMFRNPIVQENIQKLKNLGVQVLGPRLEENKAKIAAVDEVVNFVINFFSPNKDLIKKKFLITAGPSIEWVDDVRFLSNPSTGKMGIALSEEILSRGGEVTLLKGKSIIKDPLGAKVVHVESTQNFVDAMLKELDLKKYDYLISTAALADFTPEKRQDKKISSNQQFLDLHLISTPKLISLAREKSPNLYIIAFKAESNLSDSEIIEKAYDRLTTSKANLIVANHAGSSISGKGFGSDTNEVFIIDSQKATTKLELASKRSISKKIIDFLVLNA
ncbi:Coenzyme A biosynthesis bifunctional protein CoaBC [Candidatus Lokiarchaeum ossiferum]|uniref:Coenzyme A biosynthesis bifunctional protein CoaBC n=1 Tax=Candidatus Lokiarchaeum ossiferum TaxID=2951803 RepID=A0ABY6HPT9_9ARCH|nr:Coenzyme A biosynthesis bifunctional protein CoaBC [Candidatus Lokiarchaeum sp. B-35]